MITIRRELPSDVASIRKINEAAFGQPAEALLVDALRGTVDSFISLVAEDDSEIVGHICFTPVTVEREIILGLAPMAVVPERQRRGIGGELIEAGLDECRRAGYAAVVVVGHPEYYPRFGFKPASNGLKCEFDVPENVFMVAELIEGAVAKLKGVARYDPLFRVEELSTPITESDARDLAGLLVDAVESGASVSFMAPMDLASAEAYWRDTVAKASPRSIILVARDAEGIAGTVQLHPAWAPNQPHRGEIAKLLVHRRARRGGIGAALMRAIEVHAAAKGFTLLTLDTKRGDSAERLYTRAGWTRVGEIPRYALNPDGTLCDTVIFYKELL